MLASCFSIDGSEDCLYENCNCDYVPNQDGFYMKSEEAWIEFCSRKIDGVDKYGYIKSNSCSDCADYSDFKYDDAGQFRNGFAPVKVDSLWGVIDTLLNQVVEYKYKTQEEAEDVGFKLAFTDSSNFPFLPFSNWETDSEHYNGDFEFQQDSISGNIIGQHSVVSQMRIDYCETESINLKFIKDSTWKGKMIDCYLGDTHYITLKLTPENSLTLLNPNSYHVLLPDSVNLAPSASEQ